MNADFHVEIRTLEGSGAQRFPRGNRYTPGNRSSNLVACTVDFHVEIRARRGLERDDFCAEIDTPQAIAAQTWSHAVLISTWKSNVKNAEIVSMRNNIQLDNRCI